MPAATATQAEEVQQDELHIHLFKGVRVVKLTAKGQGQERGHSGGRDEMNVAAPRNLWQQTRQRQLKDAASGATLEKAGYMGATQQQCQLQPS